MHSGMIPQIIEHVNYSVTETIHDVKWVDGKSQIVAVGEMMNRNGVVCLYDLNKGDFKSIEKSITGSGVKTVTCFYSHTGMFTTACGCFDGSLLLYDISHMNKPFYQVKSHELLINKIDCKCFKDNNILITASRDGSVRIYDTRVNEEVLTLKPSKKTRYIPDCWCVAAGNSYTDSFSSEGPHENYCDISAGYDNGDIKFIDMRMMAVEYQVNVNNGVCSIVYDRKESKKNKVLCSSLEGNVYIFNVNVFSKHYGYSFNKNKIISGTLWGTPTLPQNRDIFACLGGDGNLILYKYHNPESQYIFDECKGCKKGIVGTIEKLNGLQISTQPIISLDWCKQKIGLCALSSLDQTLRVYAITKLQNQ